MKIYLASVGHQQALARMMKCKKDVNILFSYYDLSGQSGIPFRKDLFEEMVMKGFFSKQEVRPSATKKGNVNPCEVCKLYKKVESPRMEITGDGEKGILIIGGSPGKTDDEKWKESGYDKPTQFIGKSGSILRTSLRKNGIYLDKDCWKINSIRCRKPENKKITKRELKLCRDHYLDFIKENKPKFILLLGDVAVESFFMGRFSGLAISRWRGLCVPDKETNAWVIPLFHPSYILKNGNDVGLKSLFERDLKRAIEHTKQLSHPEFEDFESQVELATNFDRAKQLLRNTLEFASEVAFDYETSGLKPYWEGHVIWTLGICNDIGDCFALPFEYKNWSDDELTELEDIWIAILENSRIKKIAHNLKFEEAWSRVIYDAKVKNWHWCSMNVAHLLDCRTRFTGLKFQAYINFGVGEYDKDVKKYMAPRPGQKLNRLDKVPIKKLLLYNGMDAILTYRLYLRQKDYLKTKAGIRKAKDFCLKGLLALADVQDTGINMDEKYYKEKTIELKKRISKLNEEINNSVEAKLFKKITKRELSLRSTKDLKELLFDILELEPTKVTDNGNPSVDKEVMANIGIPFTDKLTEMRVLDKIQGTYLAQFIREIEDDKMHPFFDLHTARTYRSSSSNPNFQNIPTRSELAKKVTRYGIIPSPGCLLCEVDYGSIEVRVAACFTKDPVLVDYINDTSTCMHRDQAKLLFKMTDKEVTTAVDGASTNLRFFTKNQFVFPEFYGSWYKACARGLWDNCFGFSIDGVAVKDHVGMSYAQFENHVKKVEQKFWKRFKVFKKWQESMITSYNKKGYVEMMFGHRRGEYLNHNKIINTPIQGTAFHLLLWSLIRVNEIRKKEGWKSRIIGQIHDSMLLDVHPDEKDHVFSVINRVMCEDVREEYPWIIVPFEVDFETSPIDRPWYEKEKVKL
jgi:uracil-DNA glycosylase family 4